MLSGGPLDKPTLPRTYCVQALASVFWGFESEQDSIQSYKGSRLVKRQTLIATNNLPWEYRESHHA